jgi:hypothetical protein
MASQNITLPAFELFNLLCLLLSMGLPRLVTKQVYDEAGSRQEDNDQGIASVAGEREQMKIEN